MLWGGGGMRSRRSDRLVQATDSGTTAVATMSATTALGGGTDGGWPWSSACDGAWQCCTHRPGWSGSICAIVAPSAIAMPQGGAAADPVRVAAPVGQA